MGQMDHINRWVTHGPPCCSVFFLQKFEKDPFGDCDDCCNFSNPTNFSYPNECQIRQVPLYDK